MKLLVVSDLHWSGPGERQRRETSSEAPINPILRTVEQVWRESIWLRDPFAHNDKLNRIIALNPSADWVIANGDYTVDSAFVGLSDEAACESAELCLQTLRTAYGERVLAVVGDHEIGKFSLFGGRGGPRLESWKRIASRLQLEGVWRQDFGRYAVIGVPSSLVSLPVFELELIPAERPLWEAERRRLLEQISRLFASVESGQRLLLFCHDPTALPFLYELPEVARAVNRGGLEATVIGHLHSPFIFGLARRLAGVPRISWAGSTVRRHTAALSQAGLWRRFGLVFCPAPTGIELFKDGGWLTADLDPEGKVPIRWTRHRLDW